MISNLLKKPFDKFINSTNLMSGKSRKREYIKLDIPTSSGLEDARILSHLSGELEQFEDMLVFRGVVYTSDFARELLISIALVDYSMDNDLKDVIKNAGDFTGDISKCYKACFFKELGEDLDR